jgi:hypothetical protein
MNDGEAMGSGSPGFAGRAVGDVPRRACVTSVGCRDAHSVAPRVAWSPAPNDVSTESTDDGARPRAHERADATQTTRVDEWSRCAVDFRLDAAEFVER